MPQPPQCELLTLVLTQSPAQRFVPGGQAQVPFWHVLPLTHALPHVPQLAESDVVSTH